MKRLNTVKAFTIDLQDGEIAGMVEHADPDAAAWKAFNRKARQVALRLAQGNKLKALVLERHFQYTQRLEPSFPHVVNGVEYYLVGHNASHEFSLGSDGTHLYRRSYDGNNYCEDCKEAEQRTIQVHHPEMELFGHTVPAETRTITYGAYCGKSEDECPNERGRESIDEVTPVTIGYTGHF